ncbi:hypothetical protein C0J52_25302 [Blattella germanica]|nr:hypothetical protein C0J52_25302 [Blattella germanica]
MQMFVLLHVFSVLIPLSLAGQCPDNCKCTKWKIYCIDTRIRCLPYGSPTTQLLSMDSDVVQEINRTVINRSGLRNLTTLKLNNMHIQIIRNYSFGDLAKLESLTITKNSITDLESGAFLGLDKLYNLDLSGIGGITKVEPKS